MFRRVSLPHPFLCLVYFIPFEEVRASLLGLHSKDLVLLLFNLGDESKTEPPQGLEKHQRKLQEGRQSRRKKRRVLHSVPKRKAAKETCLHLSQYVWNILPLSR